MGFSMRDGIDFTPILLALPSSQFKTTQKVDFARLSPAPDLQKKLVTQRQAAADCLTALRDGKSDGDIGGERAVLAVRSYLSLLRGLREPPPGASASPPLALRQSVEFFWHDAAGSASNESPSVAVRVVDAGLEEAHWLLALSQALLVGAASVDLVDTGDAPLLAANKACRRAAGAAAAAAGAVAEAGGGGSATPAAAPVTEADLVSDDVPGGGDGLAALLTQLALASAAALSTYRAVSSQTQVKESLVASLCADGAVRGSALAAFGRRDRPLGAAIGAYAKYSEARYTLLARWFAAAAGLAQDDAEGCTAAATQLRAAEQALPALEAAAAGCEALGLRTATSPATALDGAIAECTRLNEQVLSGIRKHISGAVGAIDQQACLRPVFARSRNPRTTVPPDFLPF